jgi:hypothetical protein
MKEKHMTIERATELLPVYCDEAAIDIADTGLLLQSLQRFPFTDESERQAFILAAQRLAGLPENTFVQAGSTLTN